jgi:hypothetical protein
VISVILYGRNDAHGYNLHRRAALSLNCLAKVLTDPDDEIVFVDYNTPDELPTFIEAISDTLTDRCLGLLRVLRVPAAIHRQRFAARTHLSAIEPVSRNAGARRANASNRWLLSTNTDMVLLPLVDGSLSEICRDLPDGFYGLPRFELPEWLWERLPRSDPRVALSEIERLGPGLRLDEPTVSHEWIRFDAPGDFQLILRDDFVAVDGFNEEMLLGYHVDSNLSRRMLLLRGSIESLGEQVAGYHCNHNRVPTVYHGARLVSNDLDRFFFYVNRAELREQRATWGLADAALEEVPILDRGALQVGDRVASVVRDESPRLTSDALASVFGLTYDSGHVLPFIADSLAVSSRDITVGYVGANPVLQRLLVMLAGELRIKNPLVIADLDDLGSVDELDLLADVIVIDLGIDASLADGSPTKPVDYESVEFPRGLDRAFAAVERLFELERARLERGGHPRRLVLVNSATAFWDAYILANLDCSHTSVHSRVRRATVKPVPDVNDAAAAALEFAHRQLRWSARRHAGDGRLHVPADVRIKIAELDDYRGFGEGWAYPDGLGVWTQGRRSELAVTFEGAEGDSVLALAVGGICIGPDESIKVELLVDGECAARRDFSQAWWRSVLSEFRRRTSPRVDTAVETAVPDTVTDRPRPFSWRLAVPAAVRTRISHLTEMVWQIQLPSRVVAQRNAQLTFVIDEPRTPLDLGWSNDERQLGFHLRSLMLEHGVLPARGRHRFAPSLRR